MRRGRGGKGGEVLKAGCHFNYGNGRVGVPEVGAPAIFWRGNTWRGGGGVWLILQ